MFRKILLAISLVLGALYFSFHLILASSPFQTRLLKEIQALASEFGFEVHIQSVEFSAISPKVFLNDVRLTATPKAIVPLEKPLTFDKIKIQVQPTALLRKHLIISEVIFYQPRIQLPSIDRLIPAIEKLIRKKPSPHRPEPAFALTLRRIGLVDASFAIRSEAADLFAGSRTFTAYVEQNGSEQIQLTIDSSDLLIEWQKRPLQLKKVSFDGDLTASSLRVNHFIVSGEDLKVRISGTSPQFWKKFQMERANVSYEIDFPLTLLSRLPGIKLPAASGNLEATGTFQLANGKMAGGGQFQHRNVVYDDYRIGSGQMKYSFRESELLLDQVQLQYSGGEVHSSQVTVGLAGSFPIRGKFDARGLYFEKILQSLHSPAAPVRFRSHGSMDLSGDLKPFLLKVKADQEFSQLNVVEDDQKDSVPGNLIVSIPSGRYGGEMRFTPSQMEFDAIIQLLGGQVKAQGFVTYDNRATIKARGKKLSLSQLKKISTISIGGVSDLACDIDVQGRIVKLAGVFDVEDGEIADIFLGKVRGQTYFQNALLSFEKMEVAALEPVTGSGFVDFRPTPIHYRFDAQASRLHTDQALGIFRKQTLGFKAPKGGELQGSVRIEGGHDTSGLEVSVRGSGKDFTLYDEQWSSSQFQLQYRPDVFELTRLNLLKKNGSVNVSAHIGKPINILRLQTNGIRIEELNLIGKTPLAGELSGEVNWEGNLDKFPPSGRGTLKLSNGRFRNEPMPDHVLQFSPSNKGTEYRIMCAKEQLKGTYDSSSSTAQNSWAVALTNYDILPVVILLTGRDLPAFNSVRVTGQLALSHREDWSTAKGDVSLNQLEIAIKEAPLRLEAPLQSKIDQGNLQLSELHLSGGNSRINLNLSMNAKEISGKLDAKTDFQYVYPLIPGLESGGGRVTAVLRISGKPTDYELLGNARLENGTLKVTGVPDELRNIEAQLSIDPRKISIEKFDGQLGSGTLTARGEVQIDRFKTFAPRLNFIANRIAFRPNESLYTVLSGEFFIRGDDTPYLLGGRCKILEGKVSNFQNKPNTLLTGKPAFTFDVVCEAKNRLWAQTDLIDAEFKGNFHMLGNSNQIGLLGNAEVLSGSLLFREIRFPIFSGQVKFESPTTMAPRFNIAGRATISETKLTNPQQYDVVLQTLGVPENPKIRLTSTPPRTENELLSLLLLGVTNSTQANYLDLGTALMGQLPLQSKIQSELGVGIKVSTKPATPTPTATATTQESTGVVPSVRIEKGITNKTKLSYSNTLDTRQEFGIEHMLNENVSVNATAASRARPGQEGNPNSSYGIDVRYQFTFE